MKLKEFEFPYYYKGIYIRCIIVCKTIGDAAKLFSTSAYQIKNYGSVREPRNEMALKNPYLRIAIFDSSGEALYFLPHHLKNKSMKWIDATNIIDKHREDCATYNETVKKYPRGKFETR